MIALFARARREESGIAMIIAVVLSTVVLTLGVMALTVAGHADKSSARGRHWIQALHVAESGVEEAIATIQRSHPYAGSFSGTTGEGTYEVTVTRDTRNHYTISATGSVREGRQLSATRKLQVIVAPPLSFRYAFYSNTSIATKNGDVITGDIWANQNVTIAQGSQVKGSVTGATGYVILFGGAIVDKDIQSGGFNPATNYAVHLNNNARAGGSVTAGVVNPPDPITCGGANSGNYRVQLNSGSTVGGNAKTWGTVQGSGTVAGQITNNVCVTAPATQSMPGFSYSPENYNPAPIEFGSPGAASSTAVSQFQSYINSRPNKEISGTFYINQASPVNQQTRIDLTGIKIVGDTTIITNTPVFTNGVTDNTTSKVFVLISTYRPPTGTVCAIDDDQSECSVHLKNNFDSSCKTAVLVYAPFGPVAIKNNATMCGAVYSEGLEVMNNQTMTYDARVERIAGFGGVTFDIIRWTEVTA